MSERGLMDPSSTFFYSGGHFDGVDAVRS